MMEVVSGLDVVVEPELAEVHVVAAQAQTFVARVQIFAAQNVAAQALIFVAQVQIFAALAQTFVLVPVMDAFVERLRPLQLKRCTPPRLQI
jgi:hypothetical protein